MPIRLRRRRSSSRCPLQESILDEERFVDLYNRGWILGDRRGDRVHADRSALEFLDDRSQYPGVHVVEAEDVDLEQLERLTRDRSGAPAVVTHLREIANAP